MRRQGRRATALATLGRRRPRFRHNQSGILELAEVGCVGVPTFCEKNETLVRQGARSRYAYGVVSGVLRAYRLLPNGRRHITGYLMPGSFFGLEHAKAYGRSVDAITDASLLRYERRSFETLLEQQPRARSVIFGIMSNALLEAENQQIVVGQTGGLGRLARFLLYLADRQPGSGRNEKIVVPLPMNLRDISDHLCLRLETVSRFFADLTDRRIVSRPNPHNVILLRRHALEKLH